MSQLAAQWVVNAYALALTIFAAAGRRLADLFGHRRVFMVGAATTIAGSVSGGLAEGGEWRIASGGEGSSVVKL